MAPPQFSRRALVTGGAGFIGSHLCDRLLAVGWEVVCVDNLVTGRKANVEHLLGRADFHYIEHDLIEGLPPMEAVGWIFHLASPASPPGYKQQPIETLRVNSEGTRHVLEAAHLWGARFLYSSTSEAYGDPLEHPQRETYRGNVSSTGPRSMYDEGKRYGEALTMAFHRTRGVDARIARIFNTYGPRSDPNDGRLVPNFITQALTEQPLTIYGDGTQTRSLCYVSDLVEGLLALMSSDRASGEVVNLGNPEEHTILEYADLISQVVGSNLDVRFVEPAVGDDPQRRQPDISKAAELLGWSPSISLPDGLARTVEYFRGELGLSTSEPELVTGSTSARLGSASVTAAGTQS